MTTGDNRTHWSEHTYALFWKSVVSDIEQGVFPDAQCLSAALRGDKLIPTAVRIWLADYFEAGMPRPPRGRKRKYSRLQYKVIGALIRERYNTHLADVQAERTKQKLDGTLERGRRGPSEEALVRARRDLAASGDIMSVVTLRNVVRRSPPWDA
jgi:hypothetical protein